VALDLLRQQEQTAPSQTATTAAPAVVTA